ncbi:DNA methyltransferase [Metamycoplasma hominis]|uniref:DNA methyltransferase n=1 Tax=Metamycoplasma hominis TaxID=2098 RepID=UPI003DA03BEA
MKKLTCNRKTKRTNRGGGYNYDLIYIDPPYNTESAKDDGNNLSEKDDVAASKFIYRDKFSRTGWLNMMNERLKMARQLLKEDGVIFVSIDDNEQAYLKVLMDEIFGEENFVTNFIWQKKSGGGLNTYIYEGHEYILTYALNKNNLKGKLFFKRRKCLKIRGRKIIKRFFYHPNYTELKIFFKKFAFFWCKFHCKLKKCSTRPRTYGRTLE